MIEIGEDDLDKYTLDDVIFPMIGFKVKMPSNPILRQIMEDVMKEDNMSIAMFSTHENVSVVSASGSYRKIVGRATEIEHSIVTVYN